jgi:hypothetical protein
MRNKRDCKESRRVVAFVNPLKVGRIDFRQSQGYGEESRSRCGDGSQRVSLLD